MTLFNCIASGLQPSGRPWSISINMNSAASAAVVESDWGAQVISAWTNGSHGIETLFPTATTLTLTRTDRLKLVTVGTVNKLRVDLVAQDIQTLAGTSANASLPDQNCILVSLRSATPGKEGRGRIHLPAPDETLVTTGELGSTPTTRVSTAIEALRAGMASAGHQPIVLTYVLTKVGTPVGDFRAITSVETDQVIRSMRGRVKSRPAAYL